MTTIVKGGDYIVEGYPDSVVEELPSDMGKPWKFAFRMKFYSQETLWQLAQANEDGELLLTPKHRLIPRPPRTVKRKVWINWYEDRSIVHQTRESADEWALSARIACTEHELDVPEGVKL